MTLFFICYFILKKIAERGGKFDTIELSL
ncbi:MAG: hypothetical protein PWQ85_1407, partial [Geotoga sp.]|nr:hypothetical protein [Geotoga sp.]